MRLHIPSNDRKYGDLIFLAQPGVLISPNFFQGTMYVKGMHGFDPLYANDNHIIFLEGPGIPHINMKKKIRIIDIVPTILNILNITPSINYIGHSIIQSLTHS